MNNELLLNIFKKAALCRNFEDYVFNLIQQNKIRFPVYLSTGQEFISATIASFYERLEPNIFIQHRGHSTYLSFGGSPEALANELLGSKEGCSYGMGGSASIQCKEKNIFGHDGLMGSHVPIAVGHCYATNHPTIVFIGDAAAEEDYVLGAFGWASTKRLPILFVIEDNDRSILTKKEIRRCWKSSDVANAFGMTAFDMEDDPTEISFFIKNYNITEPLLINIHTNRKCWHAGAGIDNPDIFDRYTQQMKKLGNKAIEIHNLQKELVDNIWESCLK